MSKPNNTVAIYNVRNRETLTFSGVPTIETTKALRAKGWECDRRSHQWFRTISDLRTITEDARTQL